MDDLTEIYIDVLNQTYYDDVKARHIRGNLYQVVGENPDPENEHWEFATGDKVRCIRRRFNEDGKIQLVAYRKVEDDTAEVKDDITNVAGDA